jgi:pSer/pThr/pTyr-binding forkhead associated (FHA) protein
MAELIVERGPRAGTHVALSREQTCTIGSDPSCSLPIDSPGIGQQHVVVKALKDAGFGLKALAGTVTLNGQPVPAARLKDGDVVEFCGVRLRFAENGRAVEPQMLGGFKLLEVLGRGGMGTVYKAEQVSLHRDVAPTPTSCRCSTSVTTATPTTTRWN